MAFCYFCGTELEDTDKFCTNCGAAVHYTPEPASETILPEIPNIVCEAPVQPVKKTIPVIAVSCFGLSFLSLIFELFAGEYGYIDFSFFLSLVSIISAGASFILSIVGLTVCRRGAFKALKVFCIIAVVGSLIVAYILTHFA